MSLLQADARALPLASSCVQCVVTSPPYFGLRDYGTDRQIGREPTIAVYVSELRSVFREVWRVMRDDGVLWLNLGDSYNAYNGNRGSAAGANINHHEYMPDLPSGYGLTEKSLKPKDLMGVPWRVALALQDDGWYLRSDVIWHKPNPTPESVSDRPTRAHEYVFLLTKSDRYTYDAKAIAEPVMSDRAPSRKAKAGGAGHDALRGGSAYDGTETERNARSVWTIATQPYTGAHFATMPRTLAERCILSGSRVGDLVLDPFGGSGTTARMAISLGRRAVMTEINARYLALASERTHVTRGLPLEFA